MAACCHDDHCSAPEPGGADPRWRRALWIVLAVNAGMFALEIAAGVAAGSASLQADALDFLGDAANYAISLGVAGMAMATGPNPTDRGEPGTKRHVAVDARGAPLGATLSPANRHGGKMLAATLDAAPPVRRGRGRPRRRPGKLHGDKATTTAPAAPTAAGAASGPASPGAASRAAPASAATGGWWRGPSRGSRASAARRSASSGAPTSTRLHHARLRPRLPQPSQTVLLGALSCRGTRSRPA